MSASYACRRVLRLACWRVTHLSPCNARRYRAAGDSSGPSSSALRPRRRGVVDAGCELVVLAALRRKAYAAAEVPRVLSKAQGVARQGAPGAASGVDVDGAVGVSGCIWLVRAAASGGAGSSSSGRASKAKGLAWPMPTPGPVVGPPTRAALRSVSPAGGLRGVTG